MDASSPVKKKIALAYLATVLVLGAGFGLSLYQNWIRHIGDIGDALVDEAAVVSALVDGSLLDASRILDIAKRGIVSATVNNTINDKKAYEILKASVAEFSVFKPENLLGLIFYADKSGTIRATNSEYPIATIDVRDRHYFKDLLSHPDSKWSIGPRVIGRRTHTPVFHLSLPILDSHQQFNGVVMQQISVNAISDVLARSGTHTKFTTATFQHDGLATYTHPDAEATDLTSSYAAIREIALQHKQSTGWLKLSDTQSTTGQGLYVGYVIAPTFGLSTVATIPANMVLNEFLEDNFKLCLFVAIAFFVLSALFYSLYKQVVINASSRELSLRDPLTQLYNRRALDELFPKLWHDAFRQKKPLSVLFTDIDHFKYFNDTCGHEVGDLALKAVAKAVASCSQRPLDFSCRWGGEEFVLVLPETDQSGAIHVAELLLQAVANIHLEILGTPCPLKLAVSIGIAVSNTTSAGIEDDLIDMADKAMLEAKRAGRGRYILFQNIFNNDIA